MNTKWLCTAAIALTVGTGSAFAQQMDQPQKREEGARSSLPSKGAERPAMREERPAGAMKDRAAQGEPAAREPRRGDAMPQREQAQGAPQPRDTKQPTRQSETGRDQHSTVGAAPPRQDERMDRDRQQSTEDKRLQGRSDQKAEQQKQDKRGHETIGRSTDSKQQSQQQPGRSDLNKTTGANQQSDQDRKANDTGRAAEQKQQPGRDRNNQAAQPPSSSQTQTGQQTQTPSQTTGQAQQRDTTGQTPNQQAGRAGTSSSVKVSDQQRTQVIDRLRSSRDIEQARTDINIRVNVGDRLPERVRPRPLPADIISIAPEYRGYEYTVVEDEVAIIDPRSREIVDVIPERGFAADSGARYGGARVVLSDEDRQVFRRTVLGASSTATRSSSTTVGSTAGSGCLSLQAVPEEMVRKNPDLASYRYLAIGDQIVLVDPREQKIVQVID